MRKAIHTNFRYFFLFILFLHLLMLLINLNLNMNENISSIPKGPIKVKILPGFEPTRQIVESEDPETKTPPKGRARLSDKDRSFDRETKASIVKSFQKSTKGSGGKSAKGGTDNKDVSLSSLGGDIGKQNPFHKAAREYTSAKSGGKHPGDGRTVSSTNDHLVDIPPGDLTHLNTVEYKFYGYYHRIKQKLEGFWGRSVQEKAEILASQGRRIASEDSHVTALRIVMNPEGEIVDVVVLGSSGVKELDDAAIESFNDAGPFPNPPKDLVVDGRVTIEWGFVVNS